MEQSCQFIVSFLLLGLDYLDVVVAMGIGFFFSFWRNKAAVFYTCVSIYAVEPRRGIIADYWGVIVEVASLSYLKKIFFYVHRLRICRSLNILINP